MHDNRHGEIARASQSTKAFYEIVSLPTDAKDYQKDLLVPTGTVTVDEVALLFRILLDMSGHRHEQGIYGAVLIRGPYGSGKSTLLTVAANQCARILGKQCRLVRVNAHSLASAERGGTQKNVQAFFQDIEDLAADGQPVIVLVDEIETLFTERSQISGQSNPMDTIYGVNAALEGFDVIARRCPNLILVATTNHVDLVDGAMLDRFDKEYELPLPNADARLAILRQRLSLLRRTYASHAAEDPALKSGQFDKAVAAATAEFSIRQLRRLIVDAIIRNGGDFNITMRHLLEAAKSIR